MIRRTALFTIALVVAAGLGRALTLPESHLALFWPAAGVIVWWALIARSRRELAVVTITIALVLSPIYLRTGIQAIAIPLFALANISLALGSRFVADLFVRSFQRSTPAQGSGIPVAGRLELPMDVCRIFVAALPAVIVGLFFGLTGTLLNGTRPGLESAVAWVFRNLAGVIVVGGAGLAITSHRAVRRWPRGIEVLALFACTLALQWFVFGLADSLPMAYALIFPLFWSGLRMPVPVAGVHAFISSVLTVVFVVIDGGGPFGIVNNPTGLALSVQAMITIGTGLALVVATAMQERTVLLDSLSVSEQEARAKARSLAAITATIPDGLMIVDRDDRADVLNAAAGDLVTTDSEGVARPQVKYGLEGVLLSRHERPTDRALAGETIRGVPVVIQDPGTGRRRVFDTSAAPLYGETDAAPERALLLYRDVTDQFARMDELREARDRAERLFADAPHGVGVLSTDGRIVQANLALATLLGRPAADLAGVAMEEFSAHEPEVLRAHLAEARERPEELAQTDWTVSGPGDAELHVAVTSRLLPGHDDVTDTILVHVVDVSERHHYEERLAHLAEHDALTGLGNRRRFDRELASHLERARRWGHTGAILLIDLDNFKDINDTLGHDAGDHLLVAIAHLLRTSLRNSDVVARLGGDEFAILLPGAEREAAEVVASGIVERIRAYTDSQGGVTRRVTASVGVTTFDGVDQHAADLMALADMLMYDAKEAGRNTYAVLEPEGGRQSRMGARLEWKQRIERALEHNLFVLHLQPILNIKTGEISSAEALVRLVDGDELITPGRFVSIAEETGLATKLDMWVIRNGVAMLAELRRSDPTFRLSINISGSSMGDAAVEETIVKALEQHRVEPNALVLEVTETSAVSDMNAARHFAERMQKIGTRLALDDFGAGYGSFYYLKHLTFDYVKIDGEFIANLDDSAVDRSIMRSIAGIARDLGKHTIAEFVGSPEVLEIIRAEGIDYAQGFLVGQPMPMEDYVRRFGRTDREPVWGTDRQEWSRPA